MLSIKTKNLRKTLAEKHGLTVEQVDEIIKYTFALQAKIMKEEFNKDNNITPTVKIPNFGSFYVPEYIKKRLEG